MNNTVTWKIGGEAGFGIMTTGVMFSRLATRHGYMIFDYAEYPSLIRGGHNVYEVCVGKEVYSQEKRTNLLIGLNQETVNLHLHEIKPNGILVYDPNVVTVKDKNEEILYYPVPFKKLIQAAGISVLMINNITLGVTCGLFGMDINILNTIIKDSFREKGGNIVDENIKAASIGYDYVLKNPTPHFLTRLPKISDHKYMVISANESVALGAVSGGCQLYAAYPMTPTSSVLHVLASLSEKYHIVVKHVEDEIAAVNYVIGAGYAGIRAMTGTSGGGFSLMVEGLGLAGITETPIVVLMGQRPGPATGMPTWTGQADLRFLIHASQDEFPRIILAPGDMEEAFYFTQEAFNLAEEYQTPVFVLTDKYIAEGHQSVKIFNTKNIPIKRGKIIPFNDEIDRSQFKRYQLTDDGISERAFPGMKNAIFTANSYEHDVYGLSTEDSNDRTEQVKKRARKLNQYLKNIPAPVVYGPDTADLTIICWGSTKNPVREALRRLSIENYEKTINFIHYSHIWPFPVEHTKKLFSQAKSILLVEGNSQAQLGSIIQEFTGINIANQYLRYDGRPFYPEDIIVKIKELLS